MNSSDDGFTINILNNISLYLYKDIFPILYLLGNIGNLISAVVFLKNSWSKNVCVFYFKFCLVYSTCYINCNMLRTVLKFNFNINIVDSNVVICKLYYYTTFVFLSLLPTVLILASIDRLLISSQNVDTRLYSSKRLAFFSISISSVIWSIYYIHFLIQTNIQQIYRSYFVCSISLTPWYVNFVAYSSVIINLTACITMIILCLFAFKNVRRIQAIPREQRDRIRSMNKKDFQLLRCLFVQDIVYIICSMLLPLYKVYSAITINQYRTELGKAIEDFIDDIFTFVFNIPYCSNFFVFIFVSKAFRHELKRMISNVIGKNRNFRREQENKQENIEQNNVELNVVSTIVLQS